MIWLFNPNDIFSKHFFFVQKLRYIYLVFTIIIILFAIITFIGLWIYIYIMQVMELNNRNN
jgi:hypothetical protein